MEKRGVHACLYRRPGEDQSVPDPQRQPGAVVTRQKSFTPSGFKGGLQEEEGPDKTHAKEAVAYLAVGD